ncbi:UNVERIFIED_CONTAM: Heat shock protein 8 [Sesamum radiatum]|uniref:Heat shock protein 8 n=1 Tax=Sesamum radiatum TaxID=300843 RepID=A0AAW2UCK5_SESRA
MYMRIWAVEAKKLQLIFNMGAGFCDVAVTATAGGVSQIKALAGTALGGEDILLNMMRHLLPDMDSHFSTRGIDEIRRMGKISKALGREEFEDVNREIFEKCESLIKQCLHDAKVEVEDVSDVILVGGCSNIPKLRNIITGVCKREIYNGINPLEAAVRGAALEGAVASGVNDPFGSLDLLTIQATPLSIGVRADGNRFVPIIHQNTTMPFEEMCRYAGIQSPAPGSAKLSNDGHGWCAEALNRTYGSTLDLVTVHKKGAH